MSDTLVLDYLGSIVSLRIGDGPFLYFVPSNIVSNEFVILFKLEE